MLLFHFFVWEGPAFPAGNINRSNGSFQYKLDRTAMLLSHIPWLDANIFMLKKVTVRHVTTLLQTFLPRITLANDCNSFFPKDREDVGPDCPTISVMSDDCFTDSVNVMTEGQQHAQRGSRS